MDSVNPKLDHALGEASPHLAVTTDDGVATVELRRPDKHNAISYAMWQAFGRLMPVLGADDDVEVIVLRGTPGGPFSAGADIAEFTTLRSDPEGAQRYGEAVESGERAVMDVGKPTVAVVEGFAIGGGTQLAVACDLRVCGESSRFGVTPAKLGIVYALPSTVRLVETVGAAWARWILLTGELLSAQAAERIGLVHEVVPDADVVDRGIALAHTVASRAQVSLRGAKALVERAATGRTEEDPSVLNLYRESWTSPEYAEGVAAFLAKRPPDFRAARRT